MTQGLIFAFVLVLTATAAIAQTPGPPAGTIEYYHVDALGSVRAVTDASGAVVRTQNYHPFGEGVGVAPGEDPRGFTGKPRDAESGLDYFGARYYAQRPGWFTTVDPMYTWKDSVVDPQRWNRYAYVRNNPLRFTDPTGRCVYPGADCLQYLLGGAKAVGNIISDTATLINKGVDFVIAPLTDFRFGDAPRFEANSGDQRRGMLAAEISVLAGTLMSGRGGVAVDKWSRAPTSLMDEMVLAGAKRGEGRLIIPSLDDPRFRGMEKWSYSVKSDAGVLSEVHYVRDPVSGNLMDFKFIHHGRPK